MKKQILAASLLALAASAAVAPSFADDITAASGSIAITAEVAPYVTFSTTPATLAFGEITPNASTDAVKVLAQTGGIKTNGTALAVSITGSTGTGVYTVPGTDAGTTLKLGLAAAPASNGVQTAGSFVGGASYTFPTLQTSGTENTFGLYAELTVAPTASSEASIDETVTLTASATP